MEKQSRVIFIYNEISVFEERSLYSHLRQLVRTVNKSERNIITQAFLFLSISRYMRRDFCMESLVMKLTKF